MGSGAEHDGAVTVRPNSTIRFLEHTVEKHYPSGASELAIEFEKSARLAAIGNRFGFAYPSPLRVDHTNSSIEFERLTTAGSLRTHLLDHLTSKTPSPGTPASFRTAGEMLGLIHEHLTLSSQVHWQPDDVFVSAAKKYSSHSLAELVDAQPRAVVHGDFGVENIEVMPPATPTTLALFDASANHFVTHLPNEFAPIYIDIGQILAVLHGIVPMRNYPRVRWSRARQLREAFLIGYRAGSQFKVDIGIAESYARVIAACYFGQQHSGSLRPALAMKVVFNPMKDRF